MRRLSLVCAVLCAAGGFAAGCVYGLISAYERDRREGWAS